MKQIEQSKSVELADTKLERLANLLAEMLATAWLRRNGTSAEFERSHISVREQQTNRNQQSQSDTANQ